MPKTTIDLDSLREYPGDSGADHIRKNTAAIATDQSAKNSAAWHRAMLKKEGKRDAAQTHRDEAIRRRGEARTFLGQSPPVNLLRLLLAAAGAVLAVAGEFAISWSVIPALFSVEPGTLLGVSLGALPVLAATVLEIKLLRLLHLRDICQMSDKLWIKRTVFAVEIAAIAAGFYAIAMQVLSIAPCREIAARYIAALESGSGDLSAGAPDGAIRPAVLWLSVLAVGAAALLILHTTQETHKVGRRISASCSILSAAWAGWRFRRADTLARASRQVWEERDARNAAQREALLAAMEFQLSQLPRKPLAAVVDEALGTARVE